MIVKTVDGYQFVIREGFVRDMLAVDVEELLIVKAIHELAGTNKILVDVGAHVGTHTVRAAKDYADVFAIEPNPENLQVLRQNIKLNDLKNVSVFEYACGASTGEVFLSGNDSDSFVIADSTCRCVGMLPLDSLVSSAHVVKIDVEGFEEQVVLGAQRLIKECRPVFVIEHHLSRGFPTCVGMKTRIAALLPDYVHVPIEEYHVVHLPRGMAQGAGWIVSTGWAMRMFDNLKAGHIDILYN